MTMGMLLALTVAVLIATVETGVLVAMLVRARWHRPNPRKIARMEHEELPGPFNHDPGACTRCAIEAGAKLARAKLPTYPKPPTPPGPGAASPPPMPTPRLPDPCACPSCASARSRWRGEHHDAHPEYVNATGHEQATLFDPTCPACAWSQTETGEWRRDTMCPRHQAIAERNAHTEDEQRPAAQQVDPFTAADDPWAPGPRHSEEQQQ